MWQWLCAFNHVRTLCVERACPTVTSSLGLNSCIYAATLVATASKTLLTHGMAYNASELMVLFSLFSVRTLASTIASCVSSDAFTLWLQEVQSSNPSLHVPAAAHLQFDVPLALHTSRAAMSVDVDVLSFSLCLITRTCGVHAVRMKARRIVTSRA